MVRVVNCHAGVLGSNPGGPKRFSPWNNFTGGSGGIFTLPQFTFLKKVIGHNHIPLWIIEALYALSEYTGNSLLSIYVFW